MKKTYGGFQKLSNTFSYLRKNEITANTLECFRRESPTLARIDLAYGKGSSASWLFGVLQGMFMFLGVTDDKFSKEQIYNLSCNIYTNYKTLKIAEILVFISRFEAGRYGKFYGESSYALTVTNALNQFEYERIRFYDIIENQETDKKIEQSKQEAISFEEYKRTHKEKTNLEKFLDNVAHFE